MADKQISQLVAATTLNNEDLLVIQQGQVAKKLSGEALALFVYSAAGSMIDEVNSAVEEAQAAVDELLEEKNTIAQTIADMARLGTDTTLTTPAMAADAKAAGDRIADVEKDALAGLNQKTISDVAIASFDDGGDDAPVKELIVNIDPVQDLHGQDAPYPAGGGANVIPENGTGWFSPYGQISSTFSDGVWTITNTHSTGRSGRILVGVLTAGTWYASLVSMSGSGVFNLAIHNLSTTAQIVQIPSSGNTATFTLEEDTECYINSSGFETGVSTITGLMLSKTNVPYSPYENICPITGWAGCEVTRDNSNLLNDVNPTVLNAYFNTATIAANNSNRIIVIPCKPSTTYTFKWDRVALSADSENARIVSFTQLPDIGLTGSIKVATINESSPIGTFTTGANDNYLAIYFGNITRTDVSATLSASQLNLGSEALPHEAYNPTVLSVAFPSEAGTVYGGTLNVTMGELVVEWAKIILNGTQSELSGVNWRSNATSVGFYYNFYRSNIKIPETIYSDTGAVSDTLKSVSYNTLYANSINCLAIAETGGYERICVRITDISLTTKEAINAYLAQNPITVVYPLATPITYQLTPQQIRTLLKINNIWANTGNINTLIYRTIPITEEVIREIMGDYEEIIAGIESTGKATKNYYAGDLVIVNDILYKCLVNVASGETFTPGAGGNVSQTTIADELATLQALYDNLGNLALLSYITA